MVLGFGNSKTRYDKLAKIESYKKYALLPFR